MEQGERHDWERELNKYKEKVLVMKGGLLEWRPCVFSTVSAVARFFSCSAM